MAKGQSYGHGGSYKDSPPMTSAQIKAMKERARKSMEADAKRRNAEKDFDESLFNAAMGGRMYEHGGTHPTEKERGIRAQDYKGGQPLTENQLGFLTQSLSDKERELFQDMYSQGLIDNSSVKSMFRQGKPMSGLDFRESVLKDADGPATSANLNREFGKMFGDGMKTQTQGSGLAKVMGYGGQANVYKLKVDQDYTEPKKEIPEKEEVVEEVVVEEQPEDLIPADTIEAEVPVTRPPRAIREEIPVEEEVVEEVPATTPKPNFGAMPDLGIGLPRSDRTGSGDVPTQSEMGLYGEDDRPIGGGIKLIKKPTNEKGGKLYAQGGKQMSPALMAYLQKYQQKFAMGGSYKVKKKSFNDGGKTASPVGELLGILGNHSKPGNTRTGNMPVGQQASIQYLSKATEGLSPQAKAYIMKARMNSGNDEKVAGAVYSTLNP